jgi:hypothetical protein
LIELHCPSHPGKKRGGEGRRRGSVYRGEDRVSEQKILGKEQPQLAIDVRTGFPGGAKIIKGQPP